MSFTGPGRSTGLSVSAVHQRVRRLEQRGVIQSYAARIAADQIGLPLTAFVSIKPLDPAAGDDAPERLAHIAARGVSGVNTRTTVVLSTPYEGRPLRT